MFLQRKVQVQALIKKLLKNLDEELKNRKKYKTPAGDGVRVMVTVPFGGEPICCVHCVHTMSRISNKKIRFFSSQYI